GRFALYPGVSGAGGGRDDLLHPLLRTQQPYPQRRPAAVDAGADRHRGLAGVDAGAGRHGPAADRCAHGLDVPVLQLQEARPAKALELPGADPHRGDRPGRLLHPLRDLPDPRGALHPVRPGELADRAIARRQPAGEPGAPGEPREHRASAHPGDGPVSGIAILNPANLLGKELIETIESRATQWREIRLLSTREDEIGTLTDLGGAAGLVARYEPESLNGISTVYLCGPIAANRPLF